MIPVDFPEANMTIGKPPDWDHSQCGGVLAFVGEAEGGTLDGCPIFITAWKPTSLELEALNRGEPVFLTWCSNVLAPHKATTDFHNSAKLG